MTTTNVSLDWIPTTALIEWAHAHFYYLPENEVEVYEEWVDTMEEIIAVLGSRDFHVSLNIHPNEHHSLSHDPDHPEFEKLITSYNTPTQIGDDFYIKTDAGTFVLVTKHPIPVWLPTQSHEV